MAEQLDKLNKLFNISTQLQGNGSPQLTEEQLEAAQARLRENAGILDHLMGVDADSPAFRMKALLELLKLAEDEVPTDRKLDILEEFIEFVEGKDNDETFVHLGGPKVITDLLQRGVAVANLELSSLCARVLAIPSLNNAKCQRAAIDAGGLSLAPKSLQQFSSSPLSFIKLISALIQNNPTALGVFTETGGVQLLLQLLQSDDPRVLHRTVSLFSCLLCDEQSMMLLKDNVIAALIDLLNPNTASETLESILRALIPSVFRWSPTYADKVKHAIHSLPRKQDAEIVRLKSDVLSAASAAPPTLMLE